MADLIENLNEILNRQPYVYVGEGSMARVEWHHKNGYHCFKSFEHSESGWVPVCWYENEWRPVQRFADGPAGFWLNEERDKFVQVKLFGGKWIPVKITEDRPIDSASRKSEANRRNQRNQRKKGKARRAARKREMEARKMQATAVDGSNAASQKEELMPENPPHQWDDEIETEPCQGLEFEQELQESQDLSVGSSPFEFLLQLYDGMPCNETINCTEHPFHCKVFQFRRCKLEPIRTPPLSVLRLAEWQFLEQLRREQLEHGSAFSPAGATYVFFSY